MNLEKLRSKTKKKLSEMSDEELKEHYIAQIEEKERKKRIKEAAEKEYYKIKGVERQNQVNL